MGNVESLVLLDPEENLVLRGPQVSQDNVERLGHQDLLDHPAPLEKGVKQAHLESLVLEVRMAHLDQLESEDKQDHQVH